MYKYFPHTEEDLQVMLNRVGIDSVDDLYSDIPEAIRFRRDYNLPEALSEVEIRRLFDTIANYAVGGPLTVFAGAGIYDHYSPSVVQGMDISNASMYDGATATAEAAMMAFANAKKADTVLLSSTLDPKVRRVVETYAKYHGICIELIPDENGVTSKANLEARLLQGGVAGVIVQQPNYYGVVEDYTGFADIIHEQKALFIVNSIAADLAVLKTPGEWGADIAVGDGQSLGIPMSFGGPGVGYMCCTEKLIRKMPGRIVGLTKDNRDQRAFVLTLQAREQHIRRQKATSNICSNQSLMALWVTVYLSLMGKQGLKEVGELSYAGAHYMCDELLKTGHFQLKYQQPFFNEFCVIYDGDVDALQRECTDAGFMAGVKIDDHTIMFAVTEQRSKDEIDELVDLITTYSSH